MSAHEREDQFVEQVFPAELAEIRARRERVGLDAAAVDPDGAPSAERGLVGLAISGGGIRSATFALGIVQVLSARGLLRVVDYVSTVSGGGYLGSCISSLFNAPEAASIVAPTGGGAAAELGPVVDVDMNALDERPGAGEAVALRHLRNSGNYLAPGGILDRYRLPTLFLRGILINIFVFLPYVVLAVIATEVVYLGSHFGGIEPGDLYRFAPLVAFGTFVLLVLSYPIVSKLFVSRLAWRARNRYELTLALALLTSLVVLVLVPLIALASVAIDTTPHEARDALERAFWSEGFTPAIGAASFAIVAVMVLFLFAGKASANVARLRGRLALYALGLVVPGVLFASYLTLLVLSADSPFLDRSFGPDLDQGLMRPNFVEAMDDRGIELSPSATVVVRAPGSAWTIQDGEASYQISRVGEHLSLSWRDMWSASDDLPIFGLGIAIFLLNGLFVNVNITSIHGFYRDRLSQAYLIKVEDGRVVSNDRQKLSELNRPGSPAPYHLINVALNLQGVSDLDLRGRKTDFFIFSKHWSGGPRTGYCRTHELEAADRHLDLGTAMAISGAAAAPNMGRTTVRELVMILTFLNIRLGYWLPNPAAIHRRTLWKRLAYGLGVGPRFLILEALSRLDANRAYVNVSDGGHIENSAIYELLRRKCKTIIAIDGEQDPQLRFNGLVRLMRYARIDMGIRIDIDLASINRAGDGHSTRHHALGTIDYGGGETGRLIYIKLSMTGDENPYIADYAAHHPSFPHESTADQFFDEDQFEAYRALGFHAARRLFFEGDGLEAIVEKMSSDAGRDSPAGAAVPADSGRADRSVGREGRARTPPPPE